MPQPAYVQLLCPDCSKHWEESPKDLPKPEKNYDCPDCGATYRTSEFMRTDRDLENLKQLQS
ncbi:hypothetical protein [Halarchaeum sp. P4]|uniref:DUF7836 family putative zinc-binding protein n=1 Tax=Halarchaeum sp. P4 TaxID=3421639 RepID=UPI003EBE0469